jgi:hypothetical protein
MHRPSVSIVTVNRFPIQSANEKTWHELRECLLRACSKAPRLFVRTSRRHDGGHSLHSTGMHWITKGLDVAYRDRLE